MNTMLATPVVTHYFVRHSADCKGWQVCRERPDRPLALYDDETSAITEAIGLARNREARGMAAQVHVRHTGNSNWVTTWHSADSNPIYLCDN